MEHPSVGERLDGHKTYLTAVGFGLLGGYKFYTGRWEDGLELLLAGLATASLRHAIARKRDAPRADFLEDHD
jgi:hypothetical protein